MLAILKMGNPILRQRAVQFTRAEVTSSQTRELVQNMYTTVKHFNGVGLAAPQVGVSKQLLILDFQMEDQRIKRTLFNPALEPVLVHEKIKMWEGCLSVPGLVGKVERFSNVIVHYIDEDGVRRRLAATGTIAGVLQHEIDHLYGQLYVDMNTKELQFQEEHEKYTTDYSDTASTGNIKFYNQ